MNKINSYQFVYVKYNNNITIKINFYTLILKQYIIYTLHNIILYHTKIYHIEQNQINFIKKNNRCSMNKINHFGANNN